MTRMRANSMGHPPCISWYSPPLHKVHLQIEAPLVIVLKIPSKAVSKRKDVVVVVVADDNNSNNMNMSDYNRKLLVSCCCSVVKAAGALWQFRVLSSDFNARLLRKNLRFFCLFYHSFLTKVKTSRNCAIFTRCRRNYCCCFFQWFYYPRAA